MANDAVVSGVFNLISAAMGAGIAHFGTRAGVKHTTLSSRVAELERILDDVLRQVEGYHLLEDLYATERAVEAGKAARTIKTEYRNRVVEMHQCSRPEMTAAEARKRLRAGS